MTLCYFAHPIDQADDTLIEKSRNTQVRLALHSRFDWVYDPGKAFQSTNAPFDARIQAVNHAVIDEADCVFAVLPTRVPTVGTVNEICYANQRGIPTLVFTDKRPIGLGDMDFVIYHVSDVPPSKRGDDLRKAVETLYAFIQDGDALMGAYRFAGTNEARGNGVPVDVLVQGGPEINQLCYSGPLKPDRSYPGDAAWDIPAAQRVIMLPGTRARVPTGVYVAPPDNVWLHMVGRSSMFTKGLFVEPGVIDADWRGELEAKVYNLSGDTVTIEAGERIAQIIPHRVTAQLLSVVDVGGVENLPYGARGSNGWGSTGK